MTSVDENNRLAFGVYSRECIFQSHAFLLEHVKKLVGNFCQRESRSSFNHSCTTKEEFIQKALKLREAHTYQLCVCITAAEVHVL